jgi:16S rRNA (guanine527-N7)-methyltransferase
VKHPFNLEILFSFLDSQSIVLSGRQHDQFRKYLTLLNSWSRKQNLVSKNDINHLVERHFLPSSFISMCLPGAIAGKCIDIGSGGGFPGVILKIMRPEISLTLLDSSHKKVLFLEEVRDQLGLVCPIICQRCEDYKPEKSDRFKFIISRAVARLKLLWSWSRHLIGDDGQLYAFKGGDYQAEIDELVGSRLKIEVLVPGEDWLRASDYLKQKYIVKVEK